MPQLNFRSLRTTDTSQMYQAFQEAFSDYAVSFEMTEEEFYKKFVEKLNINLDLSIGAFDKEKLVGFIFTSIAKYNGKLTAYNGGTGVTPECRGQHIPAKIYELLIPKLRKEGVEQCVLEVITTNAKAVMVYEKIGFKKLDFYHCFKLKEIVEGNRQADKIRIIKKDSIDWSELTNCIDFEPSFLDTDFLLEKNLKNEQVIVALAGKEVVGYAIYQSHGRISQMGVAKHRRKQGVGSALINFIYNDTGSLQLTVLNIPKTENGAMHFLEKVGFENQINQYEMVLAID